MSYLNFTGMPFAINEYMVIDGKREMHVKLKSIVSPGLVNLIILEFAFLLLAVYIGFCMCTGLTGTGNTFGSEFVFALILFLTVTSRKR